MRIRISTIPFLDDPLLIALGDEGCLGGGRWRAGRVNVKGRDGRNSDTVQGRFHKSRTVREIELELWC